jgi:hypothetical protein
LLLAAGLAAARQVAGRIAAQSPTSAAVVPITMVRPIDLISRTLFLQI